MKIDYLSKVGAAMSAFFADSFSGGNSAAELVPTKSVAIIGAGAGGSSAAYYLNNYLKLSNKHKHSITIFEQSDKIGGRCSAFLINDSGKDKYIEVGASIFVQVNRNLVNAAKEFGLKTKHLNDENLAIWDGKEFVFEESRWWIISAFNGLRRWKFAPIKMQRILKNTINDLLESYHSPEAFHSIADFAQSFKLDKVASVFSHKFLEDSEIDAKYSSEVVEAATRVNYGSNLDDIHALGALVTLAAEKAMQIEGGNFQIFEGMVYRSKANVKLSTKIAKIRRVAPKSEGAEPRFEVTTTSGVKEIFDTIVIAAPIDSTGIKFEFEVPPIPEVKYRTIYATFVRGRINPGYFGASAKTLPVHIITTNNNSEFTSISVQTKLNNGETVTKIFSPEPISKDLLDRLYSNRTWVKSKKWKAYPKLHPLAPKPDPLPDTIEYKQLEQFVPKDDQQPVAADWGKVEIVPGVFYLNAFEPLISTMETETIAGKNIARLVRDRILGYCPVEKITKA